MKKLHFSRRPVRRRHRRAVFCVFAGALLVAGLPVLPISPSPAFAQETTAKPDAKQGEAKKDSEKAKEGSGGQRRGGRGGPPRVVVDRVIQGEVVETLAVYGRLVARQSGVIASRVRGAVGAIQVHVGDRVKKGDVLVTLVTNMLNAERALKSAELRQFTASIRTVGTQLQLASQELERLERLRKSSAFSVARYEDKQREVERYRSAITEARAKAEQSQAEVMMADINLANASIIAPFDGVVSQRYVEVGNYVSVGDKVVSVINDTSLEVEAEIPSFRLSGLAIDTPITVRPEYSPPFSAVVRAVVPEENPLARTRTVRFVPKFPPGDIRVAANENVVLDIPSGAPRVAITVAKDSILQRRGQTVVFVVDDDKVRMQQVSVGDAIGARFEIKAGLKPGDRVVVRGNERLRAGQKVIVRRGGGKSGRGGESSQRGGTETRAEGTGEGKGERRRRRGSDD